MILWGSMLFDCVRELVCSLLAFFNRARQEADIEENKRARGQSETHMGWLPFRILFWPSLRNKFLSGRHGLEVKTSGQSLRSHWRSCSVDSQRNSRNQFTILEQLTLLVALYIHDIVVQNGESRRYSIIEKRMAISDTWSRKIATKNIPLLEKDQSSDQFRSQQQRKNMDKRKKKKCFGRWVLSGSRRINVQMGKIFGVKQTTTCESWQIFKTAVGSMSWLRALGCTKMMVNELPSRLRSLNRYKSVEEEVSGGAPNSENVDV